MPTPQETTQPVRRNELLIRVYSKVGALCAVKKANPQRSRPVWFYVCNSLETQRSREQISSTGWGEQEGNGFGDRKVTRGILVIGMFCNSTVSTSAPWLWYELQFSEKFPSEETRKRAYGISSISCNCMYIYSYLKIKSKKKTIPPHIN